MAYDHLTDDGSARLKVPHELNVRRELQEAPVRIAGGVGESQPRDAVSQRCPEGASAQSELYDLVIVGEQLEQVTFRDVLPRVYICGPDRARIEQRRVGGRPVAKGVGD